MTAPAIDVDESIDLDAALEGDIPCMLEGCDDPADYRAKVHTCGVPAGRAFTICRECLESNAADFELISRGLTRKQAMCAYCRQRFRDFNDVVWDVRPI